MTIDLSFNHLWCTFLIFFENVHLPGIVLKDVKFTDFVEKKTHFCHELGINIILNACISFLIYIFTMVNLLDILMKSMHYPK